MNYFLKYFIKMLIYLFSLYILFIFQLEKGYCFDSKQSELISFNDSTINSIVAKVGGECRTVATDGNYIYRNSGRIFEVFDLKNINLPKRIGILVLPGEILTIKINGKYAYVLYVKDEKTYLQIIDIGNPSMPQKLSQLELGGIQETLINIIKIKRKIVIDERYIYVIINDETSYLEIFDISNPLSPKEVCSSHIGEMFIYDIKKSGNYIYIASGKNGLFIMDITNPCKVEIVGHYPKEGYSIAIKHNYVYLGGDGRFLIIDVSNPKSPKEIYHYHGSSFFRYLLKKVYISNNYAFVFDQSDDCWTIDITNPFFPKILSYIYLSDFYELIKLKNHFYIATGDNGLEIIDVSNEKDLKVVGSIPPYFFPFLYLPFYKYDNLDKIIHLYVNSDDDLRLHIIKNLEGRSDSISIKLLLTAANDSIDDIRGMVAFFLGEINDSLVINPLLKLINDNDESVRRYAISSLIHRIDLVPEHELLNLLNNKSPYLRFESIKRLHYKENKKIIPILFKLIQTEKELAIREEAASILSNNDTVSFEWNHRINYINSGFFIHNFTFSIELGFSHLNICYQNDKQAGIFYHALNIFSGDYSFGITYRFMKQYSYKNYVDFKEIYLKKYTRIFYGMGGSLFISQKDSSFFKKRGTFLVPTISISYGLPFKKPFGGYEKLRGVKFVGIGEKMDLLFSFGPILDLYRRKYSGIYFKIGISGSVNLFGNANIPID